MAFGSGCSRLLGGGSDSPTPGDTALSGAVSIDLEIRNRTADRVALASTVEDLSRSGDAVVTFSDSVTLAANDDETGGGNDATRTYSDVLLHGGPHRLTVSIINGPEATTEFAASKLQSGSARITASVGQDGIDLQLPDGARLTDHPSETPTPE